MDFDLEHRQNIREKLNIFHFVQRKKSTNIKYFSDFMIESKPLKH